MGERETVFNWSIFVILKMCVYENFMYEYMKKGKVWGNDVIVYMYTLNNLRKYILFHSNHRHHINITLILTLAYYVQTVFIKGCDFIFIYWYIDEYSTKFYYYAVCAQFFTSLLLLCIGSQFTSAEKNRSH